MVTGTCTREKKGDLVTESFFTNWDKLTTEALAVQNEEKALRSKSPPLFRDRNIMDKAAAALLRTNGEEGAAEAAVLLERLASMRAHADRARASLLRGGS